jgi:hypothetical protein
MAADAENVGHLVPDQVLGDQVGTFHARHAASRVPLIVAVVWFSVL